MIAALLSLAYASEVGREARLEDAVLSTRGRRNVAMVLWPRILPHTEDPAVEEAAAGVQRKLDAIVRKAAPLLPTQLAPAPQRVCPAGGGCRGLAVGALIGQQGGGCVAVGIIGPAKEGERILVPLAGTVELASTTVPFRSPPEDVVTVRELVPCKELVGRIDEAQMIAALRRQVQ